MLAEVIHFYEDITIRPANCTARATHSAKGWEAVPSGLPDNNLMF